MRVLNFKVLAYTEGRTFDPTVQHSGSSNFNLVVDPTRGGFRYPPPPPAPAQISMMRFMYMRSGNDYDVGDDICVANEDMVMLTRVIVVECMLMSAMMIVMRMMMLMMMVMMMAMKVGACEDGSRVGDCGGDDGRGDHVYGVVVRLGDTR